MSKDPRLRRQQSSSRPDNESSSSPSSTPPTPSTTTTSAPPPTNSHLNPASATSATKPVPPSAASATVTTGTTASTVPPSTSQAQTQKRSQSRARSQSRPRPAQPILPPGSQAYPPPRSYQQEPPRDERRVKEEREYLMSNRPRDPYAALNNNPPPPPPPAQGSSQPRSNGPSGPPGPPSRNQAQHNGYQGSTSAHPDFTSTPGSSVSGRRSWSRAYSPSAPSRQQPPLPPARYRHPSTDFQPNGPPLSRPDQNVGSQQSSSRNNARQWDHGSVSGSPTMSSSGMLGGPGAPTSPTTPTTPTTRGYRNPFEKLAQSASGGSNIAPMGPSQGHSGSYSGSYSGAHSRTSSGSYSGRPSSSHSGPPSGSYPGPPSGSYSGPSSRSHPGPPSGAYTGGRTLNSMGYRGSPTGGRDTPPSSLSSSSLDGERSKASVSRHRSKSRGRSPGADSGRAPLTDSAGPSRERGRSKSVSRHSRPRSPSRARSRARSRPTSRSRYRSLSRAVRQDISMGSYERSYRSPSRSKRGRYDSDGSNSEFSDSDSDYYRKNRRYKRRRFYSSSEDSSSDLDNGDSNDDSVAEVDTNGASAMRTDTSGFTPAERVNGPLVEMLSELKRLNNRYSELGEKQRRVQKRIRRITKDFESEIRELKREFPPGPDSQTEGSGKQAAQDTQSTQLGQPKDSAPRSTSRSIPRSTPPPQPTPPLAQNAESGAATRNRADPSASEPSSSRSRSLSRSRASTWSVGAINTPADTNGQNAVPPPPSLIPASAGVTAKTEDDPDESLSSIERNRRRTTSDEQMPNLSGAEGGARGGRSAPNVQNYATAPTRSIGARRVFDRATYDLPIAKLQELSFVSLGKSKAMEKIGGGGGRRPLVLNPFARGTPFENIAAVNSLDGLITLYDIDRQEKVMEIAPKLSRVIPFTETLAWVSEDTFVAVSHLKSGQTWEGVKENLARAKAAGTDVADNDPSRFSPPETQTNLISIFYGRDGELKNRIFTIQGFPHDRPIQTVTAVSRDDNTMGYVTAGRDKRLVHWKFTKLDGGNFVGGGMADVHNLHTNTILTTMYSHTSKRFYSGGLDGRYIVYDMEGRKTIVNDKLGRIVHIVQNPADPRLHAVVFSESTQYQYQLLDERVPGQKVLTLDHRCKTTVSKFSTPSWHTEGGLFCSGTDEKGFINIWDVRWAGIKLDDKSRPGKGCITADISEDGIMAARALATAREAEKFDFGVGKTHPLLWGINQRLNSSAKGRRGGPSQVLEVGGNKVAQALFHPTRNVVMIQSFDGALSFTDYNMITKSVV